jgi:hypothetical protein
LYTICGIYRRFIEQKIHLTPSQCNPSHSIQTLTPQPSPSVRRPEVHSSRQIGSIRSSSHNFRFFRIDLDRLKRITAVQEIDLHPMFRLQTPFSGLKHAHPRSPKALKPHRPTVLLSLYLKLNVNSAMQLVHLPPDPRHFVGKVDFISQILTSFGGGAERVQGGRNYARRGLLVIEDGKGGGDQDGEEDGNGAHPAHAILRDICRSIRSFDQLYVGS